MQSDWSVGDISTKLDEMSLESNKAESKLNGDEIMSNLAEQEYKRQVNPKKKAFEDELIDADFWWVIIDYVVANN